MLASSASERLYSTSMAPSARETSRIAYQTVAKIITQAAIVVMTNPALTAHRGWSPVSPGTRNCERDDQAGADRRPRAEASTMCSMPRISTASEADTR